MPSPTPNALPVPFQPQEGTIEEYMEDVRELALQSQFVRVRPPENVLEIPPAIGQPDSAQAFVFGCALDSNGRNVEAGFCGVQVGSLGGPLRVMGLALDAYPASWQYVPGAASCATIARWGFSDPNLPPIDPEAIAPPGILYDSNPTWRPSDDCESNSLEIFPPTCALPCWLSCAKPIVQQAYCAIVQYATARCTPVGLLECLALSATGKAGRFCLEELAATCASSVLLQVINFVVSAIDANPLGCPGCAPVASPCDLVCKPPFVLDAVKCLCIDPPTPDAGRFV